MDNREHVTKLSPIFPPKPYVNRRKILASAVLDSKSTAAKTVYQRSLYYTDTSFTYYNILVKNIATNIEKIDDVYSENALITIDAMENFSKQQKIVVDNHGSISSSDISDLNLTLSVHGLVEKIIRAKIDFDRDALSFLVSVYNFYLESGHHLNKILFNEIYAVSSDISIINGIERASAAAIKAFGSSYAQKHGYDPAIATIACDFLQMAYERSIGRNIGEYSSKDPLAKEESYQDSIKCWCIASQKYMVEVLSVSDILAEAKTFWSNIPSGDSEES